MDKKGQGTTLRTFLIGFIGVLFIVTIAGNWTVGILNNYNIPVDENLSAIYGNFNKTLDNSSYLFGSQFQSDLDDKSGENLNIIGGEAGVLKTMYEVIKLPFQIIPNMITTIELFGSMIGLPAWIVRVILGVIMILISSIILGIIFRSTGT